MAGSIWGPRGSVLAPSYVGVENALDLPQASTLGDFQVVCPVKIPLPDLLRKLREKQYEGKMRPSMEYFAFGVWAFLAKRPSLYRMATGIAVRTMKLMAGGKKRITKLPFADGWTDSRDMPAPSGKTFHELYKQRRE